MTSFTDSSPVEAYEALYKGAFGSASTIKQTIRYAIPIITLAISFAVGRQGGLFNIGQEAQMISAAVVALWINTTFASLPQPVLLPLMLLGGMLASALCAVIPAVLKYFFGVNEAMLFLMMNYIAQQIIQYMLLYTPLAMPGSAASPKSIAFTVSLPMEAIYVVVAMLLILYAVMMGRSTMGLRIRILGKNPLFAKASGISSTRVLLTSACIGGALAGLAGLFEVIGVYGVIYSNFASGSLTYMGITAGLLGHYAPIGMLLGGLLLGAMQSGSIMLSTTTKVPGEIVSVIQGLVMFFATVSLFAILEKRKNKGRKVKGTANKSKEVAQ